MNPIHKKYRFWCFDVTEPEFQDTIDSDFNPDIIQWALADACDNGMKRGAAITAGAFGVIFIGSKVIKLVKKHHGIRAAIENVRKTYNPDDFMTVGEAKDHIGCMITDFVQSIENDEKETPIHPDDIEALKLAFDALEKSINERRTR
jgi:hypothetical protein